MIDQFGRYYPDSFRQTPMIGNRLEITHVNGKNGADAYQMPPNSNVLLLDDSQPVVWLKTTDGAGYPTCTPYTISPLKPEPQISTTEILDRIKKLEEKVNESYVADAKRGKYQRDAKDGVTD